MIENNTMDLMEKLLKLLKKNKKRAYTIKELAKMANVFPIDVEMCIRAMYDEDLVIAKWKEVLKNNEIVGHKFYILYNKEYRFKQIREKETPDIMYQ